MASTYLSRTGIGSSNNQKKWTFSGWFKKCLNGSEQRLITSSDNSTYDDTIRFNSDDTFKVDFNNATVLKTNRVFRDINAYYHILVKVDTDQASANDRIVLYINGVDERTVGGYATSSMPNQGDTGAINYAQHYIGVTNPTANSNHFNGIMSHVHFTDSYAYDASAFGEYDANGVWKIKTSPSVSYGTNGFFILKDGNSVTDSSTNSNNYTVSGGTLTKTEDCPSNVFATLNPLHPSLNTGRSFANGNTYVALGGTARVPEVSTLGMTSGKFYAEAKVTGGSGGNSIFGITGEIHRSNATDYLGTDAYDYSYLGGTGNKINSNNDSSYGATFTTGDIIGIAVDLDNLKIYFSKNGVWQNSGDPTSGATGTGSAFTIASPSSTNDSAYFFACGDDNAFAEQRMAWNFGNGDFSGNTISSAGTNASGNGIFEYDVPTGYTALSTKGLNL